MSIIADLQALILASGETAGYTFAAILDEAKFDTTKRYIVIRIMGARGDKHVRNATAQIIFTSKANDSGIAQVQANCENVLKYLLSNFSNGCLFNCELLLDVSGPYPTASGRTQFYFEIGVKTADTIGV